jgi:hypothetical protein
MIGSLIVAILLTVVFFSTFVGFEQLTKLKLKDEITTCMKRSRNENPLNATEYKRTTCIFNQTNVLVLDTCPNNWLIQTRITAPSPIIYLVHEHGFSVEKFQYDLPCWYLPKDVYCKQFRTGVYYNDTFHIRFNDPRDEQYKCNEPVLYTSISMVVIMLCVGIMIFNIFTL